MFCGNSMSDEKWTKPVVMSGEESVTVFHTVFRFQ